MFGLSLSCQLIQGPAVRTWNCVAHLANSLWYKFNHVGHPIMPRSRRRHHSRSRTRSRSHSFDRDREPKRRKIESCESPQHKRSISPEEDEEKSQNVGQEISTAAITKNNDSSSSRAQEMETILLDSDSCSSTKEPPANKDTVKSAEQEKSESVKNSSDIDPRENPTVAKVQNEVANPENLDAAGNESKKDLNMETSNNDSDLNASQNCELNISTECSNATVSESEKSDDISTPSTKIAKTLTAKISDSKISPKRTLSPKNIQKRLEIEKQREEKKIEREKKKQEALEEKKKLKQEKEEQKLKEKMEKMEQKQKEIEEKQKEKEEKEEKKRKEREEKEQKRKEKEEKDEQKRKEKEERDEQKRKEQEEKNKEKQKLEEKKQKAAAAFANFFTKKLDTSFDEKKSEDGVMNATSTFIPFEVKSDMKLAPTSRNTLSDDMKLNLTSALDCESVSKLYLEELKAGKRTGKSGKTWLAEDPNVADDVIIVEDKNPGESIEEQPKTNKIRAKFLKFDGNRRPPYFGTWRKKSKSIKARKPFARDRAHFDYEIDSDEDWEEGEDSGESLRGSDDEDKENNSENEYEVDNEFFVPHGHLSDDEVNDEEEVVSPEVHKAKLRLLKKEFEEERQGKTQKIKPRVIGCIWYKKNKEVDSAIHEFLKPLAIISNGPVIIKKRSECIIQTPIRRKVSASKPLPVEFIPDFLKFIHGNTNNQQLLVKEFKNYLINKSINIEISKASLLKQLKQFAKWTRPESGPLRKKYSWFVAKDVRTEYDVELSD